MNKQLKPYVLVVEDEEAISTLLKYNLEHSDFEVEVADNGEDALMMLEERIPDIVLLDWMLGDTSGIQVCEQMRANKRLRNVPVIMITACGEESDRIQGLDSGADDYIVKPFSPKEVVARVNAVLRRTRPAVSADTLEFEGIVMDMNSHNVTYDGNDVKMGPTEFKLLATFVEQPGHTFTREALLDKVWGYDIYVEPRTVDVHIRRLRLALNSAKEDGGKLIQTIRSAGYIMRPISECEE